MPASSIAMRRATAIAEHAPEKLHPENRGLLAMSPQQLHDFASTEEKGLPKKKKSGLAAMKKKAPFAHTKSADGRFPI